MALRYRTVRRGVAMAAVLAVAPIALSGCAGGAFPGVTSIGCPSWAVPEDPAQATAESDVVVIGTVAEQVGSAAAGGFTDLRVWRVDVRRTITGEAGATIEIASAPPGCTDAPYRDGDDFADAAQSGDEVVVFGAFRENDVLMGLAPDHQLLRLDPDGSIPAAWPTH